MVAKSLVRFWVNPVHIYFKLVITVYLSVHFTGFSYHPRLVFIPCRWKTYSQVSSRKMFENFTFSPVSQVVPTLRQVFNKEFKSKLDSIKASSHQRSHFAMEFTTSKLRKKLFDSLIRLN